MIAIRTVAPSDAAAFLAFVRALSLASRYHRFLAALQDLPPTLLRLLTRPPDERGLGLVAVAGETIVGEARFAAGEVGGPGEFAIAVADQWQRRGLGTLLLEALSRQARAKHVGRLFGEVAATNGAMLAFARRAGFGVRMHPGDARLVRIDMHLAA